MKIIHPIKGQIEFEPYEFQKESDYKWLQSQIMMLDENTVSKELIVE